jgi:hypothetical protein
MLAVLDPNTPQATAKLVQVQAILDLTRAMEELVDDLGCIDY